MNSDIYISQNANIKRIDKIAKKIGLNLDDIEMYGKYKAKIDTSKQGNIDGNLILVTAISPTPAGEGKSTMTIGLVDALNRMNKSALGCLREPSMGPVFGRKGGATGGGYAQVIPMEDINLHFTGDMHAITSANNLISATLDNHIYQGNELSIDLKNIVFKRCLDVSDRTLREVEIARNKKVNGITREDGFTITVATEIMAILCLATDNDDFRRRIDNILVAYSIIQKPIYVKDLGITGSIMAIMNEALKPNLVQSLENNPVLIHGGPFANIAHGCSSLIATKYALTQADYVVTEAGFGSDLGSEKFINIKSRIGNLSPKLIVLVATIKSLKLQGGVDVNELSATNIEAVNEGIKHLKRHLNICSSYNTEVIVVLNRFENDDESEIKLVKNEVINMNYGIAECSSFTRGSEGALEFANLAVSSIKEDVELNYTYELSDSYLEKIYKVCTNIYGASSISLNEGVEDKIDLIIKQGYDDLPICMAKTPSSFTSKSTIYGAPTGFDIKITDVKLNAGAGFVVVYVGNVLTMPGLPKELNAKKIDVIDGKIIGLT